MTPHGLLPDGCLFILPMPATSQNAKSCTGGNPETADFKPMAAAAEGTQLGNPQSAVTAEGEQVSDDV